jgi:DNA ligase-1
MHGRDWIPGVGSQDPKGWWMSEKFDGIRCYWDGKRFVSRNGTIIDAPQKFLDLLPVGIPLDGELWCGYGTDSYAVCKVAGRRRLQNEEQLAELWNRIKYMIFDAPKTRGNYEERHKFLQTIVSQNQVVQVVPIIKCQGETHLEKELAELRKKGGEGFMLYEPNSEYIQGRTSNLLKAKIYDTETVEFVERSSGSYTLICKQKNGVIIKPKCNPTDYEYPPLPGSLLRVRYCGLHEKSKN